MTKSAKPPLPDLIDALTPVVRPIMLEHYTSNCCIATCRVLQRALKLFGYDAEPIPCYVLAFNAAMLNHLAEGRHFPKDKQESMTLFDLLGVWTVGIAPAAVGSSPRTPAFGGHVVLRVRDTLLDAAIQQVERPDKNIWTPLLLAVPLEEDFLAGQKCDCPLPGGGAVIYQRMNDPGANRLGSG